LPELTSHPPWFDSRLPPREACVLPCLLERWARQRPEALLVEFESAGRWSSTQTLSETRRAAAALNKLGVQAGDRVLAWLPNGPDMLRVWFGANYLGATLVPIHTSYRGKLLQHVIAQSGAAVMVAHADLAGRLADIDTAQLRKVVIRGGAVCRIDGALSVLGAEHLESGSEHESAHPVERWDVMMILYTSGTTGPSKGVLTTYLQNYTVGQVSFGYLGESDRLLVNLPMFHIGGVGAVYGALATGASIALFENFRTQTFWRDIRRTGATSISGLLGAMISFLLKNAPQADDADNPLRRVVLSPLTPQTTRLADRYRFDYFSGFNMTELSVPLVTDLNSTAFASCGRPRSGVECRIVDAHDIEVAPQVIGELIVRSDLPWTFNGGYNGMPEATAASWRNGWFHTGDLMYRDAHGNFFFVDRQKDAIRRRGENISSIEVEIEVDEHPAVAEVAAIGVASPDGEDEVMVVIAAKPDVRLDPAELIEFLKPRMAHFMVPRYVRILPSLPKTATNKIQKAQLRADGVTADTWDRDAAGPSLKRQRLGTAATPDG
jgi:crotonobetaine/carnitine-CoA ligase